ncbi:uncharacterized protein LOC129353180 [Poeciliopsis prolifica]|uniref:uncharacterized protein LOC129353180 n=1 Tax=Poeciliopsis prolifica TaxID=188132 RepID=UPI00241310E9|nr:uncharacterized protein LOC129353180 [Poeciliopsis prolifica]
MHDHHGQVGGGYISVKLRNNGNFEEGTPTRFPCKKTFTGTELLSMRKQSSDTKVEVKCFYTVKSEALNSPSPHSDPSYINIGLKPELNVNYLKGQFAAFTCSLPGSVKHDTTCNLYFGESSRPAATTTTSKTKSSSTNQWFCFTEIQENELLNHLRSTKRNEVSCDYRLERDGKSLSPRSDPYRFTGIAEVDLTEIITIPTSFTKTTGSSNVVWPIQESFTQTTMTVFITAAGRNWTFAPPSTAEMLLWSFGFGLAVGGILCGATFLFSLCKTGKQKSRSFLAEAEMITADETFTTVIYCDHKTDTWGDDTAAVRHHECNSSKTTVLF